MKHCLVLLCCPLLGGCFGFCYPLATQTPRICVTEPDVKSFRVVDDGSFFGLITLPTGTCQVQEVAQDQGQIPAFHDFHFYYGFMIFPIMGYNIHEQSIRLYRRGYETVALEGRSWITTLPWKTVDNINWKTANSLEAREQAIRAIHSSACFPFTSAQSNAFIAEEYLALAEDPLTEGPEHAETRDRLRKQANGWMKIDPEH